jgi:hypothetical protein
MPVESPQPNERTPTRQAVAWICRSRVVPVLLAFTLLSAALFKGYELANQELSGNSLFVSRWFLTLLVLFELAFGLWVLGGLHARATSWLLLATFFGFSEAALYLALTRQPSCRCMGLLSIPPWVAVVLDVLAIVGILAWQPPLAGPTLSFNSRRLIAVATIYLLVAIPALVSMLSYAPIGQMPSLRNDHSLVAKIRIQLKNATTDQVLEHLQRTTGSRFTMAGSLVDSQTKSLGDITAKSAPVWSIMELIAQKQPSPARWQKTADGYQLVATAPLGRTTPWILAAILLAITAGWLILVPPTARGPVLCPRPA